MAAALSALPRAAARLAPRGGRRLPIRAFCAASGEAAPAPAQRKLERDITTNPEWERLYRYEIPVLAKVLPDGTEEILPRLSPRLSVELVQKKIYSAFDQ
ncbi:hypothetical protein EJB05_20207, partial [Eragrostis curvula]